MRKKVKEKRNKKTTKQIQKTKGKSTAVQVGGNLEIDKVIIYNTDLSLKGLISQIFGKSKAIPTEISSKYASLNFDVPKLPSLISNRVVLTDKLYASLLKKGFLYIVGDKGTGKSILSNLICNKHSESAFWFSFKNISSNLEEYLHNCISSLFHSDSSSFITEQYLEESLKLLNQNTLIVFDDLPNLNDHPKLTDDLLKFVIACRKIKLLIIISSNNKPTQNLKTLFKDNSWIVNNPLFSEEEILELLIINNAPKTYINNKFVNFISSITKRHPILINSLIRFLNEHNWVSNEDVLTSLISGNFALSDKNEYFSLFSKTINDEEIKELVYRLDVIQEDFDDSHVRLVSEIKPIISHPSEKLLKIKDLWIQEIKGKFSISPLIRNFGHPNLTSSTYKLINLRLARLILSKKNINQYEATNAIMYFIKADDYNEATTLLIFSLNSVIESSQSHIYDYALFSIWANQEIPNNVSFDLKLALRSYQYRAFTKLEKDTTFIINDLNKLLDKASSSNWLGLLTTSFSLAVSEKRNKKLYYKSLIKASQIKDIEKLLKIKSELTIVQSMFLMYGELDTHEDFIDWLTTIEKLPKQKRDLLFDSDTAIDSCVSICDRLFLLEFEKVEDEQKWEKTISVLDEFENKAQALNIDILRISAICTKIIIKAEHQNCYNQAILLGKNEIKSAKNPVIKYLLYDILGREFLFKTEYQESVKYFSKAINEEIGDVLISRKIYSFLWYIQALSNINGQEALSISQCSIDYTEKFSETIPKYLLCLCYGEFAIQSFLNYKYNDSLIYFSKASDILHNEEKLLEFKKEKFIVIGNYIIYITSLLQTGAPPKKNDNGSVILKPESGALLKNYPKIISLYNENTELLNAIVLTNFALEINNEELTIFWAKKAYDIARKNNNYSYFYITAINVLIPYLIANNQYLESFSVFHNCFSNLPENYIKSTYQNKSSIAYKENMLINLIIPTLLRNGILILNNKLTNDEFINIMKIFKNDSITNFTQQINIIDEIIEILQVVLSKECEQNEAVILANNYTKSDEIELAIFSMLSTSLNKNNTPQTALETHTAIYKQIQKYYSPSKYRYCKIVIPFFTKYWEHMFSQNIFRFYSPNMVKKDLDIAIQSKEDIRINEIIKVISYGLGMK